jgi:hypothetical protein
MSPIFAMNTPPIIKKTWIKPAVKVVSVKRDTYSKTQDPKEGGPGNERRRLL